MGDSWATASLREAGVSLIDCDHRTPPACDTGYPYIAIPQLKRGRLDLSDVRRITRDQFLEWTRKANPQPDDVILSRRCNPGETAVVPPGLECALGQNLVLLRADGSRVFPPFLRWLVRSPAWWEQIAKFINVGAVFDSLRCADIPNFELPIPPLHAQQAIAHILGTLDEKIELNRKMNQTLEEMARAIFKSWFVDFDPVRAKAEGRRPSGMDTETAKLFPSEFEESELGKIPKGWLFQDLGNVATVVRGRSYSSDELRPSATALVTLKSFQRGGGYRADGLKPYVGTYKPEQVVRPGEIVVAFTDVTQAAAVIGKPAIVRADPAFETLVASLDVGIIRPIGSVSVEYVSFALLTDDFQAHAYAHTNGSAVLHLHRDGVERYPLLLPPPALIGSFAPYVRPVIAQQFRAEAESHTVAALRDALLPRLLSGELRVPQAERLVKAML